MSWADKTRCGHGMTLNEPCDYCEIKGLEESLSWMGRAVKRNEERLAELHRKTSPLSNKPPGRPETPPRPPTMPFA